MIPGYAMRTDVLGSVAGLMRRLRCFLGTIYACGGFKGGSSFVSPSSAHGA